MAACDIHQEMFGHAYLTHAVLEKAKLPGMRVSLPESIWQPRTDSDEAALTRSFASPAFTGLALRTASFDVTECRTIYLTQHMDFKLQIHADS